MRRDCSGDRISEVLPDPSRALAVDRRATLVWVDGLECEKSPANQNVFGSYREAFCFEELLSIDDPFRSLLLCIYSNRVMVHHFGLRTNPRKRCLDHIGERGLLVRNAWD